MAEKKLNACIIYTVATDAERHVVRMALEEANYVVTECKATRADAIAAQSGSTDIPQALANCIRSADLCIFLIPELESGDGLLGSAAGLAGQLGKRIVGVVAGSRAEYPQEFELASGLIRAGSPRLESVLLGEDVWEDQNSSIVSERNIDHQRCQ